LLNDLCTVFALTQLVKGNPCALNNEPVLHRVDSLFHGTQVVVLRMVQRNSLFDENLAAIDFSNDLV